MNFHFIQCVCITLTYHSLFRGEVSPEHLLYCCYSLLLCHHNILLRVSPSEVMNAPQLK